MNQIRIGIYDEEYVYVELLSQYLSDFGKGKWNISGYTQSDIVLTSIRKNKLDLIISTRLDFLETVKNEGVKIICIYLSDDGDEETALSRKNDLNLKEKSLEQKEIYRVNRYQGAEMIGIAIRKKIAALTSQKNEKQAIAIYSPIGRCGKTKFAKKIVESEESLNWIYFGLEDFSSMESYSDSSDFLYFMKTRNENQILQILSRVQGECVIAEGAFEGKQLEEDDLKWLLQCLKNSSYNGYLFDIGNGIMKNLECLQLFDYIFIPYLEDDDSILKLNNFKNKYQYFGLDAMEEKIIYLNMRYVNESFQKVKSFIMAGGIYGQT